jgi:hypothetical protein
LSNLVILANHFLCLLKYFDFRVHFVTIFFRLSGIMSYAIQLMYIRFKINWKFSRAKFQILKITHHPEEGTIKIRWRLSGVRILRAIAQPWKAKASSANTEIE